MEEPILGESEADLLLLPSSLGPSTTYETIGKLTFIFALILYECRRIPSGHSRAGGSRGKRKMAQGEASHLSGSQTAKRRKPGGCVLRAVCCVHVFLDYIILVNHTPTPTLTLPTPTFADEMPLSLKVLKVSDRRSLEWAVSDFFPFSPTVLPPQSC